MFADLQALFQDPGFELAVFDAKSPELLGSVELAQGLFFLVDNASQAQDNRPFDAGYVYGEGFVKGHGAVFVLVGGAHRAGFAGLDGLFGPDYVGAAAGGHYLKDGNGLLPGVGEGVGAGEGTVRYRDIPKVMEGFVPLDVSVLYQCQGGQYG